jgi:ABC-2 type transport system ATP-binding protein
MTPTPAARAVEASGLRREFSAPRKARSPGKKNIIALADVDLSIERGELYGLLGPNGAGKTTLLKILTTLLYPTRGTARVAGFDVEHQAQEVRRRIGLVSGGEQSGYGILTVEETLWMFGQFYGVPSALSRRRAGELIATVGLEEQAAARVNRLSTGQRQRLNFARAFMGDPEIVFLDEPTVGLDVTAARDLRRFIKMWLDRNPAKTVVLTTHYLLEADELCNRISIIDRGRILATDTPAGLRGLVSAERRVELEVGDSDGLGEALESLPGVNGIRRLSQPGKQTVRWQFGLRDEAGMGRVLELLSWRGVPVVNLSTHDPSLEDVFVAIVGHGIEVDEREGGGESPAAHD